MTDADSTTADDVIRKAYEDKYPHMRGFSFFLAWCFACNLDPNLPFGGKKSLIEYIEWYARHQGDVVKAWREAIQSKEEA